MSQETENHNVVPLEAPASVQAQASAWLARLDGDSPTEQDLQAFKCWVNQDPSHKAAFEKVAAAWDELNILTRLPALAQQRATPPRSAPQPFAWLPSLRAAAVAATVVVAVLVGLQPGLFTPQHAQYTTAVGEQKTITLPDKSVVQINTNSRLQFDYRGSVRAVYLLQGEAHFSVAKNPQRPFEVYAGTGRVRAVGTAFSVELREQSQEVNVLVTEGVVEVAPELALPPPVTSDNVASDANDPSPTTPGLLKQQRVSAGSEVWFDQQNVKRVREVNKADMQRRLAWQQGLLIFSGEPLEEVVAEISRYTDTRIIIQSDEARALRIGGQFQLGDTRAIFSALEQGFGLRAEFATNNLVYLSYKN